MLYDTSVTENITIKNETGEEMTLVDLTVADIDKYEIVVIL